MKNSTALSWILLIFLALIWGSSFILMQRGMISLAGKPIFSDVQVGALRMTIAGLVMLPFGLRLLKKVTSIRLFFALIVVGFCGNFFPAFLFTYAETGVSTGLTGVLNSFTPFFTILIGYFVFNQKITVNQGIGLFVAFLGIFLLVGSALSGPHTTWLHIAAIVLATFFYGTSLNFIKHELSGLKSLEITALAFSFVVLPALVVASFSGSFVVLIKNEAGYEGLGFIAILSIVGTCLAVVLFNRIIALKSAVFASSVTYLIPIVAVVIGCFLNHEIILWQQVLGMGVIIGGVSLANSFKKQ